VGILPRQLSPYNKNTGSFYSTQVCTDMTRFAYSLMAKRFFMKLRSKVAPAVALFLLPLVLLSCSPLTAEPEKSTAEVAKPAIQDATPPSLPVQYQKPSYLVDATSKDELDSQGDDVVLKVGANISSKTKVPLKDIMKPLASQKKLNISWASDVVQDALVDVDIQANDDFYKSIDNLLRQVDYFYEIQGTTLVIKYRETKQFHIAMPFSKQEFSTGTGGNVLGGDVGGEGIAKNVEGTIKLTSEKNEFDTWKNVTSNLESILKIERTRTITKGVQDATAKDKNGQTIKATSGEATQTTEVEVTGGSETYYFIDKPVGLITVTAPRPIRFVEDVVLEVLLLSLELLMVLVLVVMLGSTPLTRVATVPAAAPAAVPAIVETILFVVVFEPNPSAPVILKFFRTESQLMPIEELSSNWTSMILASMEICL